ncbi:cytochrome bd-I oxidase subunit CydX (plasmid) [Sphaerotilus natans]
MWYFSWALGTGFAVLLAVVNALWMENQHADIGSDQTEASR